MMRHARTPATIAIVVACLLLAGCAPSPVTTEGRDVASLYGLFMVAAAVVFVIVAGLIGWSVIRYRATPDNGEPARFQTNVPLEIVWWALPTLPGHRAVRDQRPGSGHGRPTGRRRPAHRRGRGLPVAVALHLP